MKVGAVTALSDPQLMSWDTDWWGIRTAKAESLDGLSQWCVDNSVGLVYLLVDAADTESLHAAEEHGFRVMDTRIVLARPTIAAHAASARLARAEDTSKLRAIARHAFTHTRFYADPRFQVSDVDDLYDEWTRSACAGAADAVLVVERDKQPVGYVTVHLDPGRIGLIAVACDYRGTGIGTELCHAAVDYCHVHNPGQIEVATQAANVGAIRVFEGSGFRVCSSAYWLHKWAR